MIISNTLNNKTITTVLSYAHTICTYKHSISDVEYLSAINITNFKHIFIKVSLKFVSPIYYCRNYYRYKISINLLYRASFHVENTIPYIYSHTTDYISFPGRTYHICKYGSWYTSMSPLLKHITHNLTMLTFSVCSL